MMNPSDRAHDPALDAEDMDKSRCGPSEGSILTLKVDEAIRRLDDLLDEGEVLARQAWSESAAMSILDDRTLMMRLG